ncbi:MAG: OstA-like protein, partial [Marinirhabdus sp.]
MKQHIFLSVVLTTSVFGTAQVRDITNTTKVEVKSGFLEIRPELPDAVVYTGEPSEQVYIVHEGVEMWCDQAFVYIADNFVTAYGNVRITQGDTVTMNSKYAEYNGNTQFAFASGSVVLTEPKTTLRTDTLYFDRIKQQAYYRSGGTVRDTASTLTSRIGRYFADTKKYRFLRNVKIVNPKYTVNSGQLDFYSVSGHAYLYGPSTIVGEASTVYCERGFYNTRDDKGHFVKNSRIDYENRTLWGDSIYFDRAKSFASATNNIKVLDTANKSSIRGHYAEVFRAKDSVYITKRAVAVTLRGKDSVYVHADTLQVTGKPENRIVKGFYAARLFKPGEEVTSGKCDSIYINQKKGITKLLRNPILWNGAGQMVGDTIHLLSNTETEKLDTLKVFNNAFLVQKDSIEGFNQTKGERLTGLFTDNRLDTVNIDKNAEVIYYLRNDKNELTGINNTVSGSIQMYLENQEMAGTRFIKKVKGKIYPPSKFPEELRTLPGFNWRGDERLQTVQDLFKGKPPPVLPKIKGIPLPRDEGGFFEENIKDSNIPKASKLTPSILKNRKGDAQEIQGGPQKKTAHNPAAPANRSAKNE